MSTTAASAAAGAGSTRESRRLIDWLDMSIESRSARVVGASSQAAKGAVRTAS